MAISAPRIERTVSPRGGSAAISTTLQGAPACAILWYRIAPPSIRPGGGTSCSRERPVMLLPQPLSPTSPTAPDCGIVKLTSETASITPSSVAKRTRRFSTSTRGALSDGIGPCSLAAIVPAAACFSIREPDSSIARSFCGAAGSSCVLDLVLTFEPPGSESVGRAVAFDRRRAFIQTAFHNREAVRISGRKFVFARVLAPHPQFEFGPNGEAVNPPYPYSEDDASRLLPVPGIRGRSTGPGSGQLACVSRRILEAIDASQRRSKARPAIIRADHGSRMVILPCMSPRLGYRRRG